MCPSSPSAWQISSWADPFPSLSKKLFYFVKKGLLQTAPKRDRRSRKGPPISFFLHLQPSMPPRWDGNGHSAPCQPAIDRLSPLRPLLRSASGAAGALCAKIIEACCTQDCQPSRRPEEVLNIMQNAPAALTRCAIKCISGNGKFFVIPHRPQLRTKKARQKQGAPRRTHPASLFNISQCALRPAQSALRTRKRPGEGVLTS